MVFFQLAALHQLPKGFAFLFATKAGTALIPTVFLPPARQPAPLQVLMLIRGLVAATAAAVYMRPTSDARRLKRRRILFMSLSPLVLKEKTRKSASIKINTVTMNASLMFTQPYVCRTKHGHGMFA